ncbi:hypothetical protein GCM10025783_29320 [Amnibacterium soli]|uniref:Alpha-amylase n=1 Tax=Amnibacterium soli TaxID=1282736 RepID=A0ABP8ZEA4_9MICO
MSARPHAVLRRRIALPLAALLLAAGLVRGVIGRRAPAGVAEALAQRVVPAPPTALGGGGALRFRLQEAGRFVVRSALLADQGDVTDHGILLLHGDRPTTTYDADSHGTVRSGWLAPGAYALRWVPNSGYLRADGAVVVRAGRTVTAAPPTFSRGGSIRLQVTSGGSPVAAGVPAVRSFDGSGTRGSSSTDAAGAIVLHDLAPGTHAITVGQRSADWDDDFEGDPTSDTLLPRTVVLRVTGSSEAAATEDLTPAGRVTGTVSGGADRVYAEDASGAVVRRADVEGTAFTLGGLAAGTYRILAADRSSSTYDVESVVVPEPLSTAFAPVVLPRPLVPERAMPTLGGRVPGGASGTIELWDTYPRLLQPLGAATLDRSGDFRLRTVPGRFDVTIAVDGRIRRTVRDVDVVRPTTARFAPGARPGKVVAQLTAHGQPVRAQLDFGTAPAVEPLGLVPAGRPGRVLADSVAPGRYSTRSVLTAPAVDGPWTFTAEERTFRVHDGRTTRLGTIRVTITG